MLKGGENMLKTKIALALIEFSLLAYLYAFGFVWNCIENHNYILLALPIFIAVAIYLGISWLISFVKRKIR